MPYIYETHLHTSQVSGCADTPGKAYISRYIDEGFAGVIVTDHFIHGENCLVPKNLPWAERVHRFCEGFEDARNEGAKRNFSVFFGWEEHFDGDEYLIYGLDEAWMIEHPEMEHWTRAEQYRQVHQAGGCVIQAHPFRARDYISRIHLSSVCVDGIEGVNTANVPLWNTLALRYAQVLGLPVTAGSDNHHIATMSRDNLAGVIFDQPLSSIQDFVTAVREKQSFGIHVPCDVPPWSSNILPDRPTGLFGSEDQLLTEDISHFLRNGSIR